MSRLDRLEANFNETFAHWNIRLSPADIAQRRRGKIVKAGWSIWYLFGTDDEGEYLDYYASHRMTEDSHVRIRPDGSCDDLPTIVGLREASSDPAEDARLEAEHATENRRIAEMLEAKGFGLDGDEPGGVQENRLLRLGTYESGE